jgi:multidrug efflux pump subunit AcrA (membrane-fusion protein)
MVMRATPRPGRTAKSKRRTLKTVALIEVNQGILQVARESVTHEQEWEFLCECGREDCHAYVTLTLDAYVDLHDNGRAVLARGHRLSQIERARRLGEEAAALTQQAEHQVRRAQKNLRSRQESFE